MKSLGLVLTLVVAGLWQARAAEPGSEVVVVYNSRVPDSRDLANYYAQRRHVPTNQIFGFDLPNTEDISRTQFREDLQKPLAKALEENKLWHIASRTVPATTNEAARLEWHVVQSKIRYAVLCYGVPLRITQDPNLKEEGEDKVRPEMRKNGAAVDNELALLPEIEQHLPAFGPLRNPIYTTTNSATINPTNGILMVARLDGPTPAIARGLVDKALQAEAQGLWGRAYFDIRKTTDPALKVGDDWIHGAYEICRKLGFECVEDENPGTFPAGFPMSHIAYYLGWYTEHASGPFAAPKVEFMPGAFAYHLHSFSAVSLRATNSSWVGPLLAKGVTATMGCVDEPYLTGTPDVAVFTVRFIFFGMTFGEAAYAGQAVVSWQTTVVGDPLYRPFGRNLDFLVDELEREHSPLREWAYLRLLNLNYANGRPLSDVVSLLEQLGPTPNSAVLQEKLGDLYVAQGKPSSAVFAYNKALKLDPSPQQKLRLLLTLGERLPALNRDEEAFAVDQELLKEYPDYPDKPVVYKRLAALARKQGKTDQAEKYEAEAAK